jgi:hypothetical protein
MRELGSGTVSDGATVSARCSDGGSMNATKRREIREPQPIETSSVTTGSSMAIEVVTRRCAGPDRGALEHRADVARRDRVVAGETSALTQSSTRLVGVEQHARGEVRAGRGSSGSGWDRTPAPSPGRSQEERGAEGGVERKSRHRVVFRSERL